MLCRRDFNIALGLEIKGKLRLWITPAVKMETLAFKAVGIFRNLSLPK
jgi:hypothetical protein